MKKQCDDTRSYDARYELNLKKRKILFFPVIVLLSYSLNAFLFADRQPKPADLTLTLRAREPLVRNIPFPVKDYHVEKTREAHSLNAETPTRRI